MDSLEEVVARQAIVELTGRYADLADHKDWPALTALFSDDAVFDGGRVYERTWSGHAEILDFYEHAPVATGHHPTGLHTTFERSDRAHSRLKMLVLFRRAVFTCDYDLAVVEVGGEWKIERLTLDVVGRNDLGG